MTFYSSSNPVPPEPTEESPHLQIDWIWHKYMRRYKNPNTLRGLASHLVTYKRYLRETSNYDPRLKEDPRFSLAAHWDRFTIYKAEKFWRNLGISGATIYGYVMTLRGVAEYAAELKLTEVDYFIYPEVNGTGNGIYGRAYSKEELEVIDRLIARAADYARKISEGYHRTGMGTGPGEYRCYWSNDAGWKEWDNIVWYFENVMDCRPVIDGYIIENLNFKEAAPRRFMEFVRIASKHHGGVKAIWERLGVAPVLNKDIIVPLVIQLARETGLNATSIINLSRDCYRPAHPVTGAPYIEYFKERSTGEKQLHLRLLDDEKLSDSAPSTKSSEVVRQCIDLLLKLTEPLVERARPEDKNKLMLLQVRQRGPRGYSVRRIDETLLNSWATGIKARSERLGEKLPAALNLTRFRSTRITEMVEQENDFFRIQSVAGHASARITMNYVEKHRIAGKAQCEIEKTLIRIHENARRKV